MSTIGITDVHFNFEGVSENENFSKGIYRYWHDRWILVHSPPYLRRYRSQEDEDREALYRT